MFIQLVKRSWQAWWDHLVHLTLLNVLWFVAQLLVVTAPPATAALYIVANQMARGELISTREVWTTFRTMFIPAWKWATCNILVVLALFSYLIWAQTQTGVIAAFVSVLAIFALALWLAMNLVYWPLWIEQADTGLRNTFRNAFIIVVSNPAYCFLLLLISIALTTISALTVLPLIHVLMVWLALLGENVVQMLIKRIAAQQAVS